MVRSAAFAETSALHYNLFGSTLASSHGTSYPTFGAASEAPPFQLPSHTLGMSHSAVSMLQAAQVTPETGMVQPISVRGNPQMGLNVNSPCGGGTMGQSGYAGSLLLGTGMAQSSLFGGNHSAAVGDFRGSTSQTGVGAFSGSNLEETVNKNSNPFLF